MSRLRIMALAAAICLGVGTLDMPQPALSASGPGADSSERIRLPAPRPESGTSVEQALLKRRSIRNFREAPLTLAEVSQLLWAAQGVTEPRQGLRSAPSAGATYPLEVYLVAGSVGGLRTGVYKYRPVDHELMKIRDGDVRKGLTAAALGQGWVGGGAAVFVLAAVYERTTRRYGDRGIRYVHMEVGHAAQNVCLQAVALGLGAVVVGAFHEDQVQRVIGMPAGEAPLYIMPVGRI